MPGVFEELLEKTKGFPPEFYQDLRNTAETLEAIASFAKIDIDKEAQHVIDHLPEIRKERAESLRRDAKGMDPAARKVALTDADRLEKSAAKLALPDVDESYRRRAALTELSVRLKARLRDVAKTEPELDPERLEKFRRSLDVIAKGLPADVGSQSDREAMARMAFVQELREARGNVDLAVDNLYKNAFSDIERGHWGDASMDRVVEASGREAERPAQVLPPEQQTQDYVTQKLLDEERAERISRNTLLRNLPKLAAEHLNPKEYAAYRVMIDNEHLLDWEIKHGKIKFKAVERDLDDPENTIAKILQRDLNYQDIRGATLLLEKTVGKLNKLLVENNGQEVKQTQVGTERMRKTTAEIVADPAAKAAPTLGKSKGRGGGLGV
jgi:hypothetical protein